MGHIGREQQGVRNVLLAEARGGSDDEQAMQSEGGVGAGAGLVDIYLVDWFEVREFEKSCDLCERFRVTL